MGSYKHIENCIGEYIAKRYTSVVEAGIGNNTEAARILHDAGASVRSTDIRNIPVPDWLTFTVDDIFNPDIRLYEGAEVIYAIRPAPEMIPPLISLAGRINCDLLVYHLGFELFGNGGEKIECGVLLHRYYKGQVH